jgi:hypothetical protein
MEPLAMLRLNRTIRDILSEPTTKPESVYCIHAVHQACV